MFEFLEQYGLFIIAAVGVFTVALEWWIDTREVSKHE